MYRLMLKDEGFSRSRFYLMNKHTDCTFRQNVFLVFKGPIWRSYKIKSHHTQHPKQDQVKQNWKYQIAQKIEGINKNQEAQKIVNSILVEGLHYLRIFKRPHHRLLSWEQNQYYRVFQTHLPTKTVFTFHSSFQTRHHIGLSKRGK